MKNVLSNSNILLLPSQIISTIDIFSDGHLVHKSYEQLKKSIERPNMNQANPDPGAAMDLGKKSAEDAPDSAAQDMGYWSGMLFQVIVD